MQEVATNNCESGIPGRETPHEHSLRWHTEHEGKTYIVYADCKNDAKLAFHRALGIDAMRKVHWSGYYCKAANAIYQATDGPTAVQDYSNGKLA
jgi:hypothetical protein